ncbi:MAG: hypothetical protein QM737_22040 [Ferruginibacter sp.]
MNLVVFVPLLLLSVLLPLLTACIAKILGRSFRSWFWISLALPFISCIIVLCLPSKKKRVVPVENEELFNYLFEQSSNNDKHIRP